MTPPDPPAVVPAEGDRWVVLGPADSILVSEAGPEEFVHDAHPGHGAPPVLLVDDPASRIWVVATDNDAPPPGACFVPAWELISRLAPDAFAVMARARMLAAWQRDHRFCGRCGARTVDQRRAVEGNVPRVPGHGEQEARNRRALTLSQESQ